MISLKWIVGLLAAVFIHAAQAAPLEAYGRLPTTDHVTISPDGTKLALVREMGDERMVLLLGLGSDKVIAAIKIGDVKLRAIAWAGNDHVIFTTSTTTTVPGLSGPRHEWFMASSFQLSNKERRFLVGTGNVLTTVFGQPSVRILGDHPTVFFEQVRFESQNGRLALFSKDLVSGRAFLQDRGDANVYEWVVDLNGKIVARADYGEIAKQWILRLRDDGGWKEILRVPSEIDVPNVEGISADGKSVIVRVPQDGEVKFKAYSLETGAQDPSLTAKYDFDTMLTDARTGRVIAGQYTRFKTEYVFFDPADQAMWDAVRRTFNDSNVELESWSDDRMRVVVKVSGGQDGHCYMLVDRKLKQADLIGMVYDDIGVDDAATVTDITYNAADRLEIPAYLTLPKNRPPKDLPLIVLPHGGPHARDKAGFDWWSQALASRGYAVLQPQFRGSGGWGLKFREAGYGEFGRKMQTDLSDGVRYLASKGIIDPKRVCIVGGSYGGYAALAGASLDAGVYRCAVSVAGLSDIHEFFKWMDWRTANINMRFWDRFLGVTSNEDSTLDKVSPIRHIGKINIPILLIHGRDDTVVPFGQSQDMADALSKAGKHVQFVELKSEDHWLSRSETRLQMLKATVDFLEANNPPR